MIALCNPNNPTGQNMGEKDIAMIIQMAKSVGAYLLVDEVYREEVIFGEVHKSIYGQYEKTIVNSSISKAFGLPGLRLGWTIGPKDYLEQVSIRKDYTTIAPNIMSDYIATCLLTNRERCQKILDLNKASVQSSYAIFESWAQEFKDIFKWQRPQAGAMVYVKYSLPIKSKDLMQKILQDKNILIVAGDDYDMENHIRIGIGLGAKDLKIALDKIGEVVREIRANH
jgi:aspartate/methionine/tyrosine aminotransferase